VRSGSGSYASSGSYPGSGSGSYPRSGSHTSGSGRYTPGSGGYTSGSGSYTLQPEISSSSGVGVPLSSCETGYDVCPSSDFTGLTRFITESETVTPITRSSEYIVRCGFREIRYRVDGKHGISNRHRSVIPSINHILRITPYYPWL
jgi:hypothetical protein